MAMWWLELEDGEALRTSLRAGDCEAPKPAVATAAEVGARQLRRLLWKGLAGLCTAVALSLLLCGAGRPGEGHDEDFELLFEGEVPREDFAVHAGSVCFGPSGAPAGAGHGPAGHLRLEVVSDMDWREATGGREGCTEWMAEGSLLRQPGGPSWADPRGLAFRRRNGSGHPELQDAPAAFLPWGETACGFEDHQALRVPSRGVLPLELGGRRVLVQRRAYLLPVKAGNSLRYQAGGAKGGTIMSPGSVVLGFECQGGESVWVPGRGYLPRSGLQQARPTEWQLPRGQGGAMRSHGVLTWMLFDDQETHWEALRDRLNESTYELRARAANTVLSFPAPPWASQKFEHRHTIKERSARRWHIVVSGEQLWQDQPRSRYRVSARRHLSSLGSGNFRPEECPGA